MNASILVAAKGVRGGAAMSTEATATPRGLPWFRLYSEVVDDPKLRLLAFEDRWHFVALLALKCSGVLDGSATPELLHRMVAVKLGVQVRELESIAKRLSELSLIAADTLQPVAWDRRQAPSDSSRVRTRSWRERHLSHIPRHSDGGETVQTKREKETQKEKLQQLEPVRSRGSRLPDNWQPSDVDISWATGERPDLRIEQEAEKFRDYWHAKVGKDAQKLDWGKTWRNWVRNARGGASSLARTPREALAEQSARLNRQADLEEERHEALY